MDSSNGADLEPEPGTSNKLKIDDSTSEDDENNLQMTPGDKLCEDELTLIFSNSWISPQDLLNFRLVSKSWRDAATATLLHRDVLVVKLHEDSNQAPPCFSYFYKKRRGKKTHENKLSQLTELISKSKKFPSTNFHILTAPYTFTPYTCFADLMHFFKLHGHKIKTLRPHGYITRKSLLDILLIYAPTLEHLDLSKASITALNEENEGEENALDWASKTLPFKSLTITDFYTDNCEYPYKCYKDLEFSSNNATGRDVVQLLLSSPSKLSCIEHVTLPTLGMVLTEGKGHLIRSFKYNIRYMDSSLDVVASKFLALNPTLSRVALYLGLVCCGPSPVSLITSVNSFIQSFKDTVQNVVLIFSYNGKDFPWDKLLSIPPMKKLKSLSLVIEARCICKEDGYRRFKCRLCAENFEDIIDLREAVFQFEGGISAENYFPNLEEVSLNSSRSSELGYLDVSLMNFFSFKSDTNGSFVNWNCLPKVDILSITGIYVTSGPRLEKTSQSPAKTELISQVFPNIRILKFRCDRASNLSGALWALFPNVEFIEIYGIGNSSCGWSDVYRSHYVDRAFTGLSREMLEKLRTTAVELLCEAGDLDELKSALTATAPSISDLRHLRELKLKFVEEWSGVFASSVTGLHGLSKMPNTKFIISYDPETVLGLSEDRAECSYSNYDDGDDSTENNDGNDGFQMHFQDDIFVYKKAGRENGGNDDEEIAKYEELVFGAIRPYVHIVHEKQNYREWWD